MRITSIFRTHSHYSQRPQPDFVAAVQNAAKVMGATHRAAQGSSVVNARSRAVSRSLPSAPESVADPISDPVSSTSSDVEVQEEEDPPTRKSGPALAVANIDNPASGPESEDQPTRPAKRTVRSSNPPQDEEPGSAASAQAKHGTEGKGKANSTAPPSSKRARKGSTASEAITLDSDSEDGIEAVEPDAQANSSRVLPPNNEDFWDEIRRITAKNGTIGNTSTPNPGPSRQKASDRGTGAAPEAERNAQVAGRGRGRGKYVHVGGENQTTHGGKNGK